MLVPAYGFDPRLLAATIWSPGVVDDLRLWQRLCASAAMLFRRWTEPSASIDRATRRGYQRLCNNQGVSAERLAAKSFEGTVTAMRLCTRVVLAHDTTEIDKVGRSEPDDAGPLRSNSARGYLVHGCTAVDAFTGSRLGVFDVTAWTRSWRFKNGNQREREPHKRESYKWRRGLRDAVKRAQAQGLHLTLVHAFDREGDVHENFTCALRERHLVVVRARADRLVAGKHATLWAHLKAQPLADTDVLVVPVKVSSAARKNARAQDATALRKFERAVKAAGSHREAQLQLRYGVVTFAPSAKRKHQPVTVNVVWVHEVDAPSWCTPLEWMLLTTCEVKDTEDAWRVVEEYKLRWGCEDLHKVLKHGLGLEDDPIDSLESFRRQLAIVVPLATHVVQWTYAARETPGEPSAKYLSLDLLQSIALASKHAKLAVTRSPRTLGEVVRRLAQLGGHEQVKDRPPGWQVVWRGWQRLMAFCEVLEFVQSRSRDAPD